MNRGNLFAHPTPERVSFLSVWFSPTFLLSLSGKNSEGSPFDYTFSALGLTIECKLSAGFA